MTNIWESYDFKKMEAEADQIEKSLDEKYSAIRSIIKDKINNIIGNIPDLRIISKDDRISILLKNTSVVDILMKDENTFIIRQRFPDLEVEFSLDIFKQYFPQIINSSIIPFIKELYKKDYITEIPESLIDKTKINLSKITPKWLKETFDEIAEYYNGESIDDIEIEESINGITISFEVDCRRYGVHKDNTIKISNKGDVKMILAEIIEGGDIDSELEEAIKERIKDGE